MTTHSFDLERFGNNAGLKEFLRRHSLDGLELMEIGEDEKQILQKEDVVSFHQLHYPCWYCFWKKDTGRGLCRGDKEAPGSAERKLQRSLNSWQRAISSKKNGWILKKFILSKLYIQ